jgi:succinoglycan biosynthesis transport protein ExoP
MRGVSYEGQTGSPSRDGELDLAAVGRAIMRKKGWVLGITLGCVACAAVFVTLVTPRYTSEAKVLVENQESFLTRPGAVTTEQQSPVIDLEAVSSQVQLVTSRDLARKAIKDLDLKGNPEFDPSAGAGGLLSRLFGAFSSRATQSEDRIFESYFEHLNASALQKSRVILIEFSSRDPDLAARAANKVADLYLSIQSDAKRGNARAAAAALGELIADLRTKVAQAESKAEEFRATAGLTLGANNITITGQQLTDMNAALTVARSAQAEAQAKSKMLRDMLKGGRVGEISDVGNNDLIRRLSEQRATLRSQIASESRTLLPGHPRIKELQAQLSGLDGEVRIAVEQAARSLENDARVAGARVDNIKTALNQQKKEVGGSSGDEARARELDREARLLKEQLESSVAKYQEAMARENSQATPGDARIISRAMAPQLPSFPKKVPIIGFAGVAGLLLSLGTVVSAELMSGRAYATGGAAPLPAPGPTEGPMEAEAPTRQAPAAPVEAALVKGTRSRRRPGLGSPASTSNAIAGLAARLAATQSGDYAQRILVTSEDDGSAALEVAQSLGRTLARDRRAILVSLDPGAGARDGLPGFGDLLLGDANFEDAIHRDRVSRLHLVSSGNVEIDHDENCDLILDALSRTYDFLIIVAPPLDRDELAIVLAPDADCAVIAGAGEANAIAIDELRNAGAGEVLSIALADTKAGRSAA